MLDLATFNSLIAACARSRNVSSAEMWFDRMVAAHVRPDAYSFNMIIGMHADGKDAFSGRNRAEFWFDRMQQFHVKPTADSFTALISICARLGDVVGAETWYQRLMDGGGEATCSTYGAVVDAHGIAFVFEQGDRCQHHVLESDTKFLFENAAAIAPPHAGAPALTATAELGGYDVLLKSCSHRGDVTRVEALLDCMRREGLEPTVSEVNSAIHACAQGGDAFRAEQYLCAIEDGTMDPHVPGPNVATYNTVMNACAEKGDVDRAEAWLLHLIARGFKPNEVSFGTICKAFARQGDIAAVERIMEALVGVGTPLNEYFFASLISACGAAQPPEPRRAERAFFELKRLGLRPRSVRRVLGTVVGKRRAAELIRGAGPRNERNASTRCC